MTAGCKIGRHRAPNPYLSMRGDGIWFGECPGCLQEIIKKDGQRWRGVPAGYRIVWPRLKEKDSVPRLVKRDQGVPNLPALTGAGSSGWLARLLRRPFSRETRPR